MLTAKHITNIPLFRTYCPKTIFQLRKLDKERLAFICEKKNVSIKRERLIEALKKEKLQLQERLNAISIGPHAQRELKVRKSTHQKFFPLF